MPTIAYRITSLERKAVIAKLARMGVHTYDDMPIHELTACIRSLTNVPKHNGSQTSVDLLRAFIAPDSPVMPPASMPFKPYTEPQAMRDAVARAQEWRKIPSLVVECGLIEEQEPTGEQNVRA